MNGIVPCLLVVSAVVCRRALGWNPSIRIAEMSRHVYPAKKLTALSLTPRDLERLSGSSGSEDDGEEEAAARAARETLERMWSSSSPKTSYNNPPTDELDQIDRNGGLRELPELAGEQEDGEGAQVGARGEESTS